MSFLLSDDARRNPFPWYARARAESPVLHDPRTDQWMLFDYESVKRALHDHEAFSSVVSPPESGPGKWLIFMDPPRHSKLRALVMRAFTPRAVAALEPRILQLGRMLLGKRIDAGEMELLADFAIPLPLMVIAEMLGAPVDDWPLFRRWSDGVMGLIHTVSAGPEAATAVGIFVSVHSEMESYLAALMRERRGTPRDDLLSRLDAADLAGERLNDDELLGFFELLLLAGHETTTNLIDNAVLCLIENPDQLALLRRAPGRIPQAIEEVLRYRSPVQAVFRSTVREVQLAGRVIPRGALVLAMIGSANRDERHFVDPDRFDISRDPNPHIAFGHGIHFCIGSALSRLEGRVALTLLLDQLADIRLASTEPWEPRRAFHVHGPSRLPIRFTAAGKRPVQAP